MGIRQPVCSVVEPEKNCEYYAERERLQDACVNTYVCEGCGASCCWCNGAADAHPNMCDECWDVLEGEEGPAPDVENHGHFYLGSD